VIDNLAAAVIKVRAGLRFRNDMVTGPGGA
jgi:hypothetical protein